MGKVARSSSMVRAWVKYHVEIFKDFSYFFIVLVLIFQVEMYIIKCVFCVGRIDLHVLNQNRIQSPHLPIVDHESYEIVCPNCRRCHGMYLDLLARFSFLIELRGSCVVSSVHHPLHRPGHFHGLDSFGKAPANPAKWEPAESSNRESQEDKFAWLACVGVC